MNANEFHVWKAITNFLFDKIGIRSVFHYNFKPSKNTSQKIRLFPQFYQELVSFWESVKMKSNLRASLKLLDNVFGIIPIHTKTRQYNLLYTFI